MVAGGGHELVDRHGPAVAGGQRVLGMAQGHYPIHADADQTLRLTRSPRAPELTGDAEPAIRILPGQELSRARTLIQLALGR